MSSFRPTIRIVLAISLSLTPQLLPVARAADNHSVGRLFYTPYQRDLIDVREPGSASPAIQVSAEELPPSTRFNGSVRRSGGRSTGWIGGMRIDEIDQTDSDVQLRLSGRRLAVRNANGLSLVEAGQTVPALAAPAAQTDPAIAEQATPTDKRSARGLTEIQAQKP